MVSHLWVCAHAKFGFQKLATGAQLFMELHVLLQHFRIEYREATIGHPVIVNGIGPEI